MIKKRLDKASSKTGLKIYGVAASPGIAIGQAFVLKKSRVNSTGLLLHDDNEIQTEIDKFKLAIQTSVEEIDLIKKKESSLSREGIDILETHIEFITDPQLNEDVCQEISENKKNAIDAVHEVIHKTVDAFQKMDNEYLRARAADVQDIGARIIKNLVNGDNRIRPFQNNTIIIAEDIAPSDALLMDMNGVIGFITQFGGKTSHTAILAKSKNIPAIVGCGPALNNIKDNDIILLDATGLVIVEPDEHCIKEYLLKKAEFDQNKQFLNSLKDLSAQTKDGVRIKLLANISCSEDLDESLKYGAEGVGLFRTEWFYMSRTSFPDEDEQFEFYKKVALKSKGKPVTIRTLDIGGDKPLTYFNLPKEENPFLGYRGIRISLDRKDIFSTQLKAILRASIYGHLKIMFPMITNLEELRNAMDILNHAKNKLKEKNIEFDTSIQVGIMIEVPSAAIMADILAKEVDFFSIGTNDLCQYTLAVDRGNEKIKEMYDPFEPAVLRLIRNVIEQADKNKISVSICGELASDPDAALLLLGMGLKEFSMNSISMPLIKNIIINNSYSKAKEVYNNVLGMDNSKSIKEYLQLHQ